MLNLGILEVIRKFFKILHMKCSSAIHKLLLKYIHHELCLLVQSQHFGIQTLYNQQGKINLFLDLRRAT